MRFRNTLGALSLVGLLGLSTTGCSGEGDGATAANTAPVVSALDAARVAEAWPVKYAVLQSSKDYQGGGWVSLLMQRNYRAAAERMGSDNMGQARAHAEAASLFRLAALVSANALIQTYALTPEDTDPVGAAHLVAVGYALNGDLEKARESSARLDGVEDITVEWHEPWKAWLGGDAAWPPDLSGLPIELPEPAPGQWPVIADAPQYKLPVRVAGDRTQDMGDPGILVALALWHDAAAKVAAGDQAGAVDVYTSRYRFPIEPEVTGRAPLPEAFVFGSDMLVPGDGAFLADLHGAAGAAAVDKHKDTSLIAQIADASRVGGKVDAEKALDVITSLRKQMLDQAKAQTNNTVEAHQRNFADMGYVGALRSVAIVAEVEGNREESGKLRINAWEVDRPHTRCAVARMSLAAWDASNRYPTRAQDIIHENVNHYPSLETARYGLDVMALRVSREVPGTPSH